MSQAYNLLWISPKILSEDNTLPTIFNQPIPSDTAENMKRIAAENSSADVRLWVDSRRLTEAQMKWLQTMTATSESGNFTLHDLRKIDTYDKNFLFNQSETSDTWKYDKQSLIWRQVDAAKLLICLEGDYEQTFFSDADTTINITSKRVQKSLNEYGLIVRGMFNKADFIGFENQAFGFNRTRVDFFRKLYYDTLQQASKGKNGYELFIDSLRNLMGESSSQIAIETEHDGTAAWHPDEQNTGLLK